MSESSVKEKPTEKKLNGKKRKLEDDEDEEADARPAPEEREGEAHVPRRDAEGRKPGRWGRRAEHGVRIARTSPAPPERSREVGGG